MMQNTDEGNKTCANHFLCSRELRDLFKHKPLSSYNYIFILLSNLDSNLLQTKLTRLKRLDQIMVSQP